MKVLGLIEQDLDIASKEYVDNKVKEVAKVDDVAPEGYVKLDLSSLWGTLKLSHSVNTELDTSGVNFAKILQKCYSKEKVALISADVNLDKKHYEDSEILNIVKANPICYIKEADYTEYIVDFFGEARPLGRTKTDMISIILWVALIYRKSGVTEDFYHYLFGWISDFVGADGKTQVKNMKYNYNGESLTRDLNGLQYLIQHNPYLYTDTMFYGMFSTDMLNPILSSNGSTSKNPSLAQYIKVDLPSLVMAIPSDENYKAAQTTKLSLLAMLIGNASDKNAVGIFHKYQVTEFTEEMLEKIMLNDPEVYVEKESFKNVLDTVNLYSPALLEKNIFGGVIKINTSSLYMISNLLKTILPNGSKINPDEWCEKVLISCMNRDGKMVDISGKSITEVIGTEKEVYIDGDTFNDLIIKTITEDFKPVGKRKGYELMKTHYAIYLCSLAHRVKNSRLGQNQQFFKLIKDGYSVNEYDERKTLVSDLGFTYDESAPESSYDIDALSNFTNKHPEIYVPTEFTDYVKGTAESTMELFGAVTNLMAFYEAHQNDPKIKIVTPNEYKINRKDPDTLYIVKES